jgi:WD40 repeat protein
VCIWNMRDGSAKVLKDNFLIFWSVRFSSNGQFVATGNYDGTLRTWNVRTGQLVRRWTGHKGIVRSVTFTPDGMGLVTGDRDGIVKWWDVSPLGNMPSESDGEPEATKILECKGHSTVCLVLSLIYPLTNFR